MGKGLLVFGHGGLVKMKEDVVIEIHICLSGVKHHTVTIEDHKRYFLLPHDYTKGGKFLFRCDILRGKGLSVNTGPNHSALEGRGCADLGEGCVSA
jgi:hypothetical protein